jgi:DNA-binding MarR family transcriptional regulator
MSNNRNTVNPVTSKAKRTRQSVERQLDDPPQTCAVQLGILPQLLGYELRLAQRAVFADFADTVGPDISPGLFGVLVIVESNPGLKQTELSAAVGLDRSSMVPVIDKLEKRKLVVRRSSPTDKRSYGLFLTATGATLLKRLKKRVQQHETQVASKFTTGERATLLSLLERLNRP